MTILGSDPSSLDSLARSLERTSSQMENAAASIDSSLGSLWWEGAEADRFRSSWTRHDRSSLLGAASELRGAASDARLNANQQRLTSFSFNLGSAIGSIGSGIRRAIFRRAFRSRYLRDWFETEGIAQLAAVRYNEGAQPDWWASLDDDEREALLRYAPGELTFMHGLPEHVRLEARERYIESVLPRIETDSMRISIGAKVDVDYGLKFSLGVEGSVAQQNYADGSTVITLELDAETAIGLGLGIVSVAGIEGGKVSVSYRFASPEEADRFLRELRHELLPHGNMDKVLLFTPLAGIDALGDGAEYLKRHRSRRESLILEGTRGSELSVGADGNEIKVRGEVGVAHDFEKGETSVFFEHSVDLDAHALGQGVHADASIKGEAIFEDGELVGFKLATEGSFAVGHVVTEIPGVEASALVGKRISLEASVDLTDPVSRAAVEAYLDGQDVSLGEVLNRAEVVIYTETTGDLKLQLAEDVGAIDIEVGPKVRGSERGTTYVKPPGGSLIPINDSRESEATSIGGDSQIQESYA